MLPSVRTYFIQFPNLLNSKFQKFQRVDTVYMTRHFSQPTQKGEKSQLTND